MNDIREFFGDAIFKYTRADAMRDGILIDVSAQARQYGYRCSVAIGTRVWHEYVEPPKASIEWGETIARRVDAILERLRFEGERSNGDQVEFSVVLVTGERRRQAIELKALFHLDDDAESPAITILFPNED